MLNKKVIKIIGIGVSALGLGVNFISDWVDDKKLDIKVKEAVELALSKMKK